MSAGRRSRMPCVAARNAQAGGRLNAVHRASGDAVQEGAPGGAVVGCTVHGKRHLLHGWGLTLRDRVARGNARSPAACRSSALESALANLDLRSSGVPPRGAEAVGRDRLRRSGREALDARVVTDRFTRGHRVCRCRSGQALESGDSNDLLSRSREVRKRMRSTAAGRQPPSPWRGARNCQRGASTDGVPGTPVTRRPPRNAELRDRPLSERLSMAGPKVRPEARRLAMTSHGRVQQSR